MIRVLHSVSYMHRAGVETFLMNYYRHIDRTVVQFDFLCNKKLSGDYDEEIQRLGGRIFYRPGSDLLCEQDYVSFWEDFLKVHPEISIIHTHNGAKQYYPLQGAMKAGFPIRIAHAHSTGFVPDDKHEHRLALIKLLPQTATHYFGCSDMAGRFFFGDDCWGEKGTLIRNAIPSAAFVWNPSIRRHMRAKLNIEGCFVIGHVGRFQEQKNHLRLLEIFKEVHDKKRNAKLLLIGNGKLLPTIINRVGELGISDAVLLVGEQANMPYWYQAMDVFVMPSLFEGLTLSGVEAQAAGLPCVFSDAVSRETQMTDPVQFISLEDSNAHWAETILKYVTYPRIDTSALIEKAGYNIFIEAKRLQTIYLNLLSQNDKEN
ncbi:glycosyltransferase family 1 protein [Oscillospiraceae bacterium CLA-AA-H272]|jgi:glycosyltransferase involved in cell wall biosynthesis|uniref:Glycosyltransferase family 1 protein n=1 Tax=Brotocaccenecus cirricatena TaxID=3064195 RepID=A0AAE3DDB8_9FIRM|nr:glycosyltransferase family 1 protein [Brotocaccenecus cirricatena]MCC2128782.1 glycosyltransferase family 1 protein [Brotocaccenecus cirricatena]